MIIGAHSIIYSTDPEADRAFLRDTLGLPHVDVGDGWLIFGLPPAEIALHPSDENDEHEFFFMVDDADAFTKEMRRRKINCTEPRDLGWGVLMQLTLPSGGTVGVYEPRHERPRSMPTRPAPRPGKDRKSKRAAPKKKPARTARKAQKKKARKK
jgi:hypothetical protein